MEAGLDSIGAVELRNAISEAFGVELSATATFDYPSAEALAKYIAGKTGASGADTSAWAQPSMVAVSAPARAAYVQQIAQELADIVTGKPSAMTLQCCLPDVPSLHGVGIQRQTLHPALCVRPVLRAVLTLCTCRAAWF